MDFSRRLRVLAYHGITDPQAFRAHLAVLEAGYTVVDARSVVDDFAGRRSLPSDAVWITFDDGHQSVVELGLPVLAEHQMSATMFVCPGLVENREPFWWDVVEAAGLTATAFKSLPDADRRAAIEPLWEELDPDTRALLRRRVADTAALRRWHDSGFGLGNHSFDHPMLDQCDAAAQTGQIADAHTWLEEFHGGTWLPTFAYPNGNATTHAEQTLHTLGYPVAALFDHRANRRPAGAFRSTVSAGPASVSRLRMSDDASPAYLRSVLQGWRPWLSRASIARANLTQARSVRA